MSDDEYLGHFTKWSIDNGYIHRQYQNWANSIEFTDGKLEFESKFDIQLENWDFSQYPYLDTFKWLNMETGVLTNYRPDSFSRNSNNRLLVVASGHYERGDYFRFDDIERGFGYSGDIVDVGGGRYTISSNCRYCETSESYIIKEEAKWSKLLEDYIYADISLNSKDLVIKRMEYILRYRGNRNYIAPLNENNFNKWIEDQQNEWIS
jgi:hypothetical protein